MVSRKNYCCQLTRETFLQSLILLSIYLFILLAIYLKTFEGHRGHVMFNILPISSKFVIFSKDFIVTRETICRDLGLSISTKYQYLELAGSGHEIGCLLFSQDWRYIRKSNVNIVGHHILAQNILCESWCEIWYSFDILASILVFFRSPHNF